MLCALATASSCVDPAYDLNRTDPAVTLGGDDLTFPLGTTRQLKVGDMITDRFGITAPDPEKSRLVQPGEADVVLVPMVAFDKKNRRMGQGGGYYDRYLIRCPQARRIAVAFAEQEVDVVVADALDLPMDLVVRD